jgi:uncharacterized protein YndB with AHSA1/START domain
MTAAILAPDTFTIERTYDAVPERVFHAWTDAAARAVWFVGPDGWKAKVRESDPRTGGRDVLVGLFSDGSEVKYEARHEDVLPNERMITSYHMYRNDVRISVSLSTVQFVPAGSGTRLMFTEHLICLNGYEDPGAQDRARGVGTHLDRLAAYLKLCS